MPKLHPPPPAARVPIKAPLTPVQEIVVDLIARGHNYIDIAERLGISPSTVKFHTERAARKIVGNLPAQMRVAMWYRGASAGALCWPDAPPAGSELQK